MNVKRVRIDFGQIDSLQGMHACFKQLFGFPDFYGNNVNALIDCMSDLRYPEHGMTKFHLAAGEVLVIEVLSLLEKDDLIVNHFLTAIKGINKKDIYAGNEPSIYLLML